MKVSSSHVRILADDFAASFKFYHEVLGLTVKFGSAEDVYADFDGGGGHTIALFIRSGMDEATGRANVPLNDSQPDRVVLCLSVDSVDEAYAELQGKGVQFIGAPTTRPDWGVRTVHFRDPNGNLIELNQSIANE